MSKRDREIEQQELDESLIRLGEMRLDREFKARLDREFGPRLDIEFKMRIEKHFAECEICGCVVFKNFTTKGKGEVRQRGGSYSVDEDFIYYPYYCKLHKPKPATKKPAGNTGGTR